MYRLVAGSGDWGDSALRNNLETIKGIVEELLCASLKRGATKIDIGYEELDHELHISLTDNGKSLQPKELAQIRKLLNQPRRMEIENYYGQLAGEWMAGKGLDLVGMMVDRAEVEPGERGAEGQEGLRIVLHRKK